MVVDRKEIVGEVDRAALDEAPALGIGNELVAARNAERLARHRAQFLVPAAEVGGLGTREQVGVEMRPGLVVPAVLARHHERPDGVRVRQRSRVGIDTPGVGEVAVLAFQRRAPGHVVLHAQPDGGARARVGIELRLVTEAPRNRRVGVADRPVGVVEESFLGNRRVVERRNEIARQDLCQAHAVLLPVEVALERGIVGPPHDIVAQGVTQRQRRQVAEHVLADRERVGRRVEVGLFTGHVIDAHRRVAAQVIHAQRPLRAFLGIRTRRRDDVDRGRADHVDVVVADE